MYSLIFVHSPLFGPTVVTSCCRCTAKMASSTYGGVLVNFTGVEMVQPC